MLKYLIALFALLPLSALCQDKKDDLITITPSDTMNLYGQVIAILTEEKIKISKPSDGRQNFVSTRLFYVGKYNNPIMLNFRLVKGKILLFGYLSYNHNAERLSLYNWKPGWQEMDRIAKTLGTVAYSREE